jgi:hypothetical protein
VHHDELDKDLEGAVERLENEEVEEAGVVVEAEGAEHVFVIDAESEQAEHEDDLHGAGNDIPNNVEVRYMAQFVVDYRQNFLRCLLL